MELNLSTLAKHFSDEEAAWELVEHLRWPAGPICPHCGDVGRAYFLKPRNGNRTTSTGRVSYRRLWKCAKCRKPFSVLVGTIFERSQVPLSKWLLALYLMSASKNGIAANELRRVIGVTQPAAWFMLHRLREAMRVASFTTMRGTIVADEVWIGGDPGRMNAKTRARWEGRQAEPEPITPGARPNQRTAKTPVLSLINASTGEVRSQVVPDVTGATLRKVIAQHVDMAVSVLWTDEGSWYEQIGREFREHATVNHSAEEYVGRRGQSTNRAEGFFAQLTRSIDGTHHHVSREHLHRYLAEHDFRFSTCKMSDSARMERIINQAEGRRLTYRRVTAA
ncbi:MAG: IS1595 family transposase [Acidimicrobiales bacterium]